MSVTVRALVATLLICIAVVGPAHAQPETPDPEAFAAVIEAQIAAFARDDGVAAFAFASPGIRSTFMTAERFMAMVRAAFQPVYRPRAYSFEAPAVVAGVAVQPVRLIGPDGRGVVALYRMERQADGSWRIAGVTLHPIGERGI